MAHAGTTAEGRTCPICMEEITKCEILSTLLCGHVFCEACLGHHLRTKNECPVCRQRPVTLAKANKTGKPIRLYLDLTGIRRPTFEPHTVQAHLQEELEEEQAKNRKLASSLEEAESEAKRVTKRLDKANEEIISLRMSEKHLKGELLTARENHTYEKQRRKRLEDGRTEFEAAVAREAKLKEEELERSKAHYDHVIKEAENAKSYYEKNHFKLDRENKQLKKKNQELEQQLAEAKKAAERNHDGPKVSLEDRLFGKEHAPDLRPPLPSKPAPAAANRPSPAAVAQPPAIGDDLHIFDEEPDVIEIKDSSELPLESDDDPVFMPGAAAFRSTKQRVAAGDHHPKSNLAPKSNVPRNPLGPVNTMNNAKPAKPAQTAKRPHGAAFAAAQPPAKKSGSLKTGKEEQRDFMKGFFGRA
ncbi:hypothetical protein DFJ74DRAFT_654929 [Hyaloraphidium curvatum]|nr:hypothetical protein DFJ74DRAFT_654929 [Hyaloraphidium curvatum]